MDKHEPSLLEQLAKADRDTIEEILRQAEIYLESQLSAGIAADQRAMTAASILASALAVVIAAGATLVVAGSKYQFLVFPFIPMVICFTSALWLAVQAAKPTDFRFRGNAPSHWSDDLNEGKDLTKSLAEQALHYDDAIATNDKVLRSCGGKLESALHIAFLGLVLSAATSILVIFAVVSQR